MMISTLVIGILLGGDLLAIRVGRAETISQGTMEHAVILVEGGKIVAIGEDLPVERGIPTFDRPDWVVTPGLVNCHSQIGMGRRGSTSFDPQQHASDALYPRQDDYQEILEQGVTTLALCPQGAGVPGQSVVVRPYGKTAEEMIVQDDAYLLIHLRTSASSKKMLRNALEKVDDYDEKVAKAREKWEKDQEKKKKKKKSKKDDEDEKKDDEKKEEKEEDDEKKDESDDVFTPPEPDDKVVPFISLREGKLSALMSIQKASDYLHLLDVIEEEEFEWSLRAPLRNDVDLFHVAEQVGEKELRIVMTPLITLQPNSLRRRNIPAEFQEAGAQVVFIPRFDSASGHEDWLQDIGHVIAAGMDRDAALAGVTLQAAHVLGLGERLGSLDEGKDANLVFWNGDPFEPGTEVQAVMLEGDFVYEKEDQ